MEIRRVQLLGAHVCEQDAIHRCAALTQLDFPVLRVSVAVGCEQDQTLVRAEQRGGGIQHFLRLRAVEQHREKEQMSLCVTDFGAAPWRIFLAEQTALELAVQRGGAQKEFAAPLAALIAEQAVRQRVMYALRREKVKIRHQLPADRVLSGAVDAEIREYIKDIFGFGFL